MIRKSLNAFKLLYYSCISGGKQIYETKNEVSSILVQSQNLKLFPILRRDEIMKSCRGAFWTGFKMPEKEARSVDMRTRLWPMSAKMA